MKKRFLCSTSVDLTKQKLKEFARNYKHDLGNEKELGNLFLYEKPGKKVQEKKKTSVAQKKTLAKFYHVNKTKECTLNYGTRHWLNSLFEHVLLYLIKKTKTQI